MPTGPMKTPSAVALLMLFVPVFAAAQTPVPARSDDNRTIIVTTGMARESFVPDKVTMVVTLEAQGMTAEDAASRLSALEHAVLDTLKKTVGNRGITQSFGYGVSPYRNPNGPASMMGGAAFVGRGVVRIELDHADDLNRVTSAATAKGGSPSGNPSYTSSASDSLRRVAIGRAFELARGDAEALARAAGGKLGKLVESSSANVANPYSDAVTNQAVFISSYAYDGAPRIVPNSVVTATVTTRWELIR